MPHRSFWLELTSRDEFKPQPFPPGDIVAARATAAEAPLCRHLWTEVGRNFWSEREEWSPARWHQHLAETSVAFWVARHGKEPIGFFELLRDGADVKLEGFGLLPAWRDRGWGGGLLSVATEQAFEAGARRIWLHTATDDHPHALPNYLKRGYRIYREDILANPMPE